MSMSFIFSLFLFFFQAEDGIRDVERSRGLGDVYKRQGIPSERKNKSQSETYDRVGKKEEKDEKMEEGKKENREKKVKKERSQETKKLRKRQEDCLLYTSDAADDTPCVDLGGCRIIKKKK
eukprot:TRINITY_DN48808_c0_g1_i1.p3 TRINITY_DN48808_c0_g1~~TRINITY_DN48808_c0_g1_i1.p3  ORF type:complete len:121 (-),score=43.17 TRINITY_DN48808_c0_g1_i1:77-439(-)